MRAFRDVARLSPLPSAKNPIIVFLGVRPDGRTALFLLSKRASVGGGGKCMPSGRDCEFLKLKLGQRERVDVLNAGGTRTGYRFRVTAIHLARLARRAAAGIVDVASR